jgi:hypothetical protein
MTNAFFSYHDEELVLIKGKLSELQIAPTTVNLLEQLQRKTQRSEVLTGIGATIAGLDGFTSMSAMLSAYDGEDMFNFAGMLDDQIVCGVFEDADKLKSGDVVAAVTSKRGDVLYVHSLLREADSLLLLPINAMYGPAAFFRNCMRLAWRLTKIGWIFFGIIALVCLWQGDWPLEHYLPGFLILFLIPPLIMFPMEYWSYRTMAPTGDYAERIFRLYGFASPEYFDATPGMSWFKQGNGGYIAINADRAVQKHKSRYKSLSL